jgi:biopolymer transport protein ExbB
MLIDELAETWAVGGWIMWPILFTGIIAFYLILMAFMTNGRDLYLISEKKLTSDVLNVYQNSNREAVLEYLAKEKGLAAEILRVLFLNPNLTEFGLRELLREKWVGLTRGLERGLHLIGVMGSIAPLLGLLGTVEGMSKTFEILGLFGNSNPALLSRGIAEALIAVQSGLLVAAPILLLHQRLTERVDQLKLHIELSLQEVILVLHPKGESK